MKWGTPILGNVTALKGVDVTGNHRDRSMQHTRSRFAAWDPHSVRIHLEKRSRANEIQARVSQANFITANVDDIYMYGESFYSTNLYQLFLTMTNMIQVCSNFR